MIKPMKPLGERYTHIMLVLRGVQHDEVWNQQEGILQDIYPMRDQVQASLPNVSLDIGNMIQDQVEEELNEVG